MMKKIFENRFVHAIVALLISIGFWCYVVVGSNPTYTANMTISNIVYDGLSDLTDKGFYFIGELPSEVEIRATGERNLVTKVNDDYSAKIDFTGIKGAGEYELRVKVNAPSGVEVKRIKPDSIKVKIDAGKTKKVSTTLETYGKNVEDYEISLVDEAISVSGPSSVISKIADFEVKINTEDIEKTGKAMYRATPLDSDGKEVIDEKLTFDNIVTVNVERVKPVEVIVDESLIPAYIKELYNVSVTVDNKTVNIVGEDSVLQDIEKIEAGLSTVMLNPKSNPQQASVQLVLPENVHLAEGEKSTVSITIKYESVEEDN